MSNIKPILLFSLSIFIVGCATPLEPPPPAPVEVLPIPIPLTPPPSPVVIENHNPINQAGLTTVKVFYATDRNKTGSPEANNTFGSQRGDLTYGTCLVTIPASHKIGEMETPNWMRFQLREDPEKFIVLTRISPADHASFYADLKKDVATTNGKSAFVFIHGYNVAFRDAARRTAQMSFDIGQLKATPVFFSWPSRGKLTPYEVDGTNIDWAKVDIENFLKDFFAKSDAQHVYIIAHSMGNRAMTEVVAKILAADPSIKPRLKEIILAAPDIDKGVFINQIAPALTAAKVPITLYTSSKDEALIASKRVHGYPRVGDSRDGEIEIAGINTIDASNVDTGFVGHSYFGSSPSVISDISYIMDGLSDPDQRFGLKRIGDTNGQYWIFKK